MFKRQRIFQTLLGMFAALGTLVAEHEVTRIEPGTQVLVRTDQYIDNSERDYRIYTGIVDQNVRGGNGKLAIPRGSQVEMIVRTARDGDLILDLESVTV